MKAPLPTIDGIAPSCCWLPTGEWKTLLAFLTDQFPDVTPDTWIARMNKGEVVDSDGTPLTPTMPYRGDSRIFYYRELASEIPIPFEATILYQDERIVVVDKPHFLPVIPSGRFLRETLLVRLKNKLALDDLTPIHRLDRETAGVMIFCKDINLRGHYQSLFQKREVKKSYEAIAPTLHGASFPLTHKSRLVDGEPFFRSQEVAGEPNTETHVSIIESVGELTHYHLQPVTGKRHQLRVHMAALGAPIINDTMYPDVTQCAPDDFSQPLQLLAKSIAFEDPTTKQALSFTSKLRLRDLG